MSDSSEDIQQQECQRTQEQENCISTIYGSHMQFHSFAKTEICPKVYQTEQELIT